jgi:hypothetical protein
MAPEMDDFAPEALGEPVFSGFPPYERLRLNFGSGVIQTAHSYDDLADPPQA